MKLRHDKNYNVYVGGGNNPLLIGACEVVEFEDNAFAQAQFDLNPELLIKTEDKADRVFDKDGKEVKEAKPEPKVEEKPKQEDKVTRSEAKDDTPEPKVEEPKKEGKK